MLSRNHVQRRPAKRIGRTGVVRKDITINDTQDLKKLADAVRRWKSGLQWRIEKRDRLAARGEAAGLAKLDQEIEELKAKLYQARRVRGLII